MFAARRLYVRERKQAAPSHEKDEQGKDGLAKRTRGVDDNGKKQRGYPGGALVGHLVQPEKRCFQPGRHELGEERTSECLRPAQNYGDSKADGNGISLRVQLSVTVQNDEAPPRQPDQDGAFGSQP